MGRSHPLPPRTVMVVPGPEILWPLALEIARDAYRRPPAWARAHKARIQELPEDAALRDRWLPDEPPDEP